MVKTLMTTVAERIADLAARHGIDGRDDRASWLARHFSRLADVEGDDTLCLIADLKRDGVLSATQATDLVVAHYRVAYRDVRK